MKLYILCYAEKSNTYKIKTYHTYTPIAGQLAYPNTKEGIADGLKQVATLNTLSRVGLMATRVTC